MSTGSTLSEDSSSDINDATVVLESRTPLKNRRKSTKENGTNGFVVLEPMLPPCRICAEKASGFHYGANTCEACKAFFRRSLHKGTKYKCSAGGTCEVLPGKRNSCPACRLKKCIDLGMSKSAVKTGRYTHAKKARDIMEVKGLSKDIEVTSSETVAVKVDPANKKSSSSNDDRKPRSSESDVDEMDQIIQRITKVQVEQSTWTPEFMKLKDMNEKLYLEQRALQEEIFGPMKPISRVEFMKIYESTGIEVDGRREILQAAFFPFAEDSIKRYVLFLKSIPGFVQLPIKDQTSLIKASSFDSWMLLSQRAFNPHEKLFINQCGQVISVDDLDSLCDEPSVNDKIFEFQKKLHKLDLTQEENCTLAAMSVMTTDNCDLEARDQVAQSHALLLNCFLHLADKFHGDDPLFIARVVSLLVEMRTLRALHKEIEDKVALQWSGMVEIPPLLSEIWSSGDLTELV